MQRIKKLIILARGINLDEDAVICDFAETYHILNYKDLKPSMVGVLFGGLSEKSRIKRKMSDSKADIEVILLATIADSLKTLVWFNSEDGANKVNRPPSILKAILQIESTEDTEDNEVISFNSGEEFEKQRKELLRLANGK